MGLRPGKHYCGDDVIHKFKNWEFDETEEDQFKNQLLTLFVQIQNASEDPASTLPQANQFQRKGSKGAKFKNSYSLRLSAFAAFALKIV